MLSNELFWYVIESELALLAVCLPALSGLGRTRHVSRISRSVQSKLSSRPSKSTDNGEERKHRNEENNKSSVSYRHVGILPDVESQKS
jgi:hypothetical protein